jgi:ubiquinone/menaquinone biosynthesis C-methylase UbiE
MIELARQNTDSDLNKYITFQVTDATKQETYEKINNEFDIVICNMALMDISDITKLFQGVSKLLKLGGSFIVTQTHPCFEKAVGPIFHEVEEGYGTTTQTHGVKVSKYLNSFSIRVKAVPTLPKEHLFFHRSLSNIFQTAFQAGFVVDGLEEIAFPKKETISEHNGWHLLDDVPVIIGIRFKLNMLKL